MECLSELAKYTRQKEKQKGTKNEEDYYCHAHWGHAGADWLF